MFASLHWQTSTFTNVYKLLLVKHDIIPNIGQNVGLWIRFKILPQDAPWYFFMSTNCVRQFCTDSTSIDDIHFSLAGIVDPTDQPVEVFFWWSQQPIFVNNQFLCSTISMLQKLKNVVSSQGTDLDWNAAKYNSYISISVFCYIFNE